MNFEILGPLRVIADDERELVLGGEKPAAILAMLLLRPNEPVSSERLIEDLWDGRPPATAAKTLQVHMSRLRRAIGETQNGDRGAIVTGRGGYVLELEPDQLDALRFERLVSEGRAALSEGACARASARLRAALGLWRGSALADFAYASFAQDAIARLEGLRTVALESAVEAELALGRHAELVPELKSLVKRHPLSEHIRAQLMLALYRSGRQAEALGVYRSARRILVEQLGLEPSAELRELERAILAQDAELAAPVVEARPRRAGAEKSSRGALVGYERELGGLEDFLESALAGRGSVALIAGDPGVGKTRLADELSGVASARGARIVWGRCSTVSGAPAYWPWIQVLRALVADRDPTGLRTELGSTAAELTQLLPELRDRIPDVAAVVAGDSDDARFRLFDAVATFIARSASARPTVIVLDDLHVADRSTLALLEFVTQAASDASLMMVGTYREMEVGAGHPLTQTLSSLTRTTDCLQLVLTGLSPEDTAHLVELSARVSPLERLAAAIHAVSSGNPLFVSELVRLLAAENRLHELEPDVEFVLPRGVDQVIARRLDRLSADALRTLEAAAVVGREFDLALLANVRQVLGDTVLGQIDDAVAARLVEPVSGNQRAFRFSHELVRQSLVDELGAADRCRLHDSVGRALEDGAGARRESVAAELAYHFSEALPAGDAAKAIHYLQSAGDAAADVSASPEAAAHYARAAEIAAVAGSDAALLCELYIKLAEQLLLVDDLRGARAAIEEVEALAGAAPDRLRDARLTVVRAHLVVLGASHPDEERLFEAIELFEELGDVAGAARGWWALVNVNCGLSARLEGAEANERMLECAKRAGSEALTNKAARHLSALLAMGAAPVSIAITRTRTLFAEATDPAARARMLTNLGWLEAKSARFDEARALIAEGYATAVPSDRLSFDAYACSRASRVEMMAGNMHRAEEFARTAAVGFESQGQLGVLSSEITPLVDTLIELGRLEEAAAELGRADGFTVAEDVDAQLRQARSRARLAQARGDLASAETEARAAVEIAEHADAPDEHAECLLVLAHILRGAGRQVEADDAAAEALRISEAMENLVLARQARDLLGVAQEAVAG
jgi:DNA-binding SARP family transcriptional activator